MASIQWAPLPFDFVSPAHILSAGVVLPVVCIALVLARFYVRRQRKLRLEIDDWLIALGVVMITGMGACLVAGERLGVMGYAMPVPEGTVATEAYGLFLRAFILQAKIQFALQFLLCLAYAFVKTSILFFSRRLFLGHRSTKFDFASWLLIGLSVAWSLAFLITLIFGCGRRVWLHWAPLQVAEQSGCNVHTPEEAMVISDLILDVMILALPLPVIWRLKMKPGRKLAITGVFLVGLVAVAASAARLAIYMTVLSQGYGAGYDINRTASTMLWWSMVEASLAAIASCLPTLSYLAKEVGSRRFFYRLGAGSGSSGSRGRWKLSSRSRKQSEPDRSGNLQGPISVERAGMGGKAVVGDDGC
ncbi:hypothetical protein CDD83_3838 [Cordyceps sp. RAO-2017]|nr:hypothetical protein CDD83_3838 [Cordyceps sp. RAO-2017]